MTAGAGGSWRRPEALLFLLAAVLQLGPLLAVSELPMQDLPQHLAKLRVLVSYDEPSLGLERFYTVGWLPAPYVSFYAFGAALAGWIGIEAAARVWVALYVVGFPLSVRAWLSATGASRGPLAWLALPLVYHPFYYLGFTNLLMGLPLFFGGLALLTLCLRGRAGMGGRLAAAGVAVLIYLTHPFVFLLFVVAALLLIVAAVRERRRWPPEAAFLLPAGLAFAAWAALLVGAGTFDAPPDEAAGVFWYGPATTLGYVARFLPGPYAWPGRTVTAVAWLLAALILVLLGARRRGAEPAEDGIPARGLAWVAGGVALLVLLLPFKFTYANYINLRPLPFLAPLCLALLPPRLLRGAAARLTAAALAVTLLAVALHHHRGYAAELAPLRQVLAQAEPGRRLLPLVFDVDGRTFDDPFLDPLIHAPAYYHAAKGGAGPYFQALTLFPVRLRDGVELPAPSEYHPERFDWATHAPHYDLFLTYRPTRAVRGELFRNARLAAAADGWFLFTKRVHDPSAARSGVAAQDDTDEAR